MHTQRAITGAGARPPRQISHTALPVGPRRIGVLRKVTGLRSLTDTSPGNPSSQRYMHTVAGLRNDIFSAALNSMSLHKWGVHPTLSTAYRWSPELDRVSEIIALLTRETFSPCLFNDHVLGQQNIKYQLTVLNKQFSN